MNRARFADTVLDVVRDAAPIPVYFKLIMRHETTSNIMKIWQSTQTRLCLCWWCSNMFQSGAFKSLVQSIHGTKQKATIINRIIKMGRILSIIFVIIVISSQIYAQKCRKNKKKCRNEEPLVLNVSQLEPGHKAQCPGQRNVARTINKICQYLHLQEIISSRRETVWS